MRGIRTGLIALSFILIIHSATAFPGQTYADMKDDTNRIYIENGGSGYYVSPVVTRPISHVRIVADIENGTSGTVKIEGSSDNLNHVHARETYDLQDGNETYKWGNHPSLNATRTIIEMDGNGRITHMAYVHRNIPRSGLSPLHIAGLLIGVLMGMAYAARKYGKEEKEE